MSKIDWSLLTAREVYEALRGAPKVAGPWETEDLGADRRHALDGTVIAIDDLWLTPAYPVANWRIPNHGRADADAILRKHGWLLVDDDATPAVELEGAGR